MDDEHIVSDFGQVLVVDFAQVDNDVNNHDLLIDFTFLLKYEGIILIIE